MAKEFKDWVDEFVKNGANPKNVPHWPEEAGGGSGTKVVTELPQVGEEHTIYELHTTIPPKFNYVFCVNENEFRYVFENEEAFRDFAMNIANHYNNHNEFYCYCLAEDELIRMYYNSGSANWTLYDKEKENVFIYNNQRLCICKALIDERTALLLNGKQVPIGDSNGILYSPILIHQVKSKVLCDEYKFGMVLPIMNRTLPSCVGGMPNVLLMSINFASFCTDPNSGIVQWVTNDGSIKVALPYVDGKYRYDKTEQYFFDVKTGEYYTGEFEWVNIEDFNFKDYVDYETYDTIPLSEGAMGKPFIFDPSGKSTTSYWIYKNGEWVNVDEDMGFKTQEKTVSPSTNIQEINPDEGYDGLSKVTVEAIKLQYKKAMPDRTGYEVRPDEGYDGLSEVTVGSIKLQYKEVNPTTSIQHVEPDINYIGLNGVIVNAMKLQEKTVNPTTSQQNIGPDTNYDGLSQITINAITSDIDSNIKSGNIKKGITILGVTGTYDNGGATYTCGSISTQFPRTIVGMGIATVGSNVYLFGGKINDYNNDNYIHKFDANTETITTLSTTLPKGIYNMGVAQVGGNIYLFGGYSQSGDEKTIYKFDADTEKISTLSTTLPQKLYAMNVATVGSNVYLFGGYSNNSGGGAVNAFYKFNTKTETITTLSITLPQTLDSMSAATIGSNVYIFGGYSRNDSSGVNTIYKFDTDTETITTLSTTLPERLYNVCVSQVGSNMYLFGGSIKYGGVSDVNTIYKFDVETETITKIPTKLQLNESSLRAAKIGSKVYLFGGSNGSKQNIIYKFKVNF